MKVVIGIMASWGGGTMGDSSEGQDDTEDGTEDGNAEGRVGRKKEVVHNSERWKTGGGKRCGDCGGSRYGMWRRHAPSTYSSTDTTIHQQDSKTHCQPKMIAK